MKNLFALIAVLCLTIVTVQAQSDKYIKAMKTNIAALDSLKTPEAYTDIANSFQRIADAEKNQWLPYYYAAFGFTMTGYMQSNGQMNAGADKVDPLADKAEENIKKAEALAKDNSEIWCLKKMIATLRLMGDPMNRYMTYGPQAAEAIQKAKTLNPENPRVYLLEAQDKFYTPEQFGGSKTEAKKLFELSEQKFQAFKPASDIDPTWGLSQVKFFLAQIK